jgi:hypothetical protein
LAISEKLEDGKKSLQIPKGQSETVYQRRTDNTMDKKKTYKRTNNDRQNIHIYLFIVLVFMIMKIILHVINAIRDGPDDVLLHNYRVMVFNATFNKENVQKDK